MRLVASTDDRSKAPSCSVRQDEQGLALLMTVFVVALVTLLVMDSLKNVQFYQRSSRSFTESIQADYVLKSALSVATAILELPQLEENRDPLGEVSLPLLGSGSEVRLLIADEDGKIDINTIAGSQSPYFGSSPVYGQNPATSNEQTSSGQPSSGTGQIEDYWKNSLREVFALAGFAHESYAEEDYRTLGNVGYGPSQQVAVLHDWIDTDSASHSNAVFDGEGIESSSDKKWFFNRPFRSLAELALVPGMTLERLARVSPFVKVSQDLSRTDRRVNVNSAPYEVLVAMGFTEAQALEMEKERTNLPITDDILRKLSEGHPQLQRMTKINSSEFSVYCRVKMPNVNRWLKAVISAQRRGKGRKAMVRSMEIH